MGVMKVMKQGGCSDSSPVYSGSDSWSLADMLSRRQTVHREMFWWDQSRVDVMIAFRLFSSTHKHPLRITNVVKGPWKWLFQESF